MKRTLILTGLLFGLTTLAVAQNQVSLGDVARQPKPTKKASRVITNEEIPSRPEEPAAPDTGTASSTAPADGAAASAPATGTVVAAKPAGGKEEPPEVVAIKGRLKEVTSDELNLASTIKDIEASIAREQDSDRRRVLTNMLENQKRSLARRQEEHADLRKKLDQAQKPN